MVDALAKVLAGFGALDPEDQAELRAQADVLIGKPVWLSNPGPQTDAVECLADEVFYGGEAGGGKTDLLIGLALTEHERSLLLRRVNKEVKGMEDRLVTMLDGNRSGLNSQLHTWRGSVADKRRLIDMGGVQHESSKQNYKGIPHDLIGFDEVGDFTETQYRFIIAWNRSTTPGQRVRVVATGNPPTTVEGLWVVKYWGPWLDPNHPNPAEEGELRWYTTIAGEDVECADGTPIEVTNADGKVELVKPISRTFIRAKLDDNPDLAVTDYGARLSALPDELRRAYKEGKFTTVITDADRQVFPLAWIMEAVARWMPEGADDIPMSVLAHDVALGGGDANVWSARHGYWFAKLIYEKTRERIDPIELAGKDIIYVRDGAPIAVDMGGGYGSGEVSHLINGIKLDPNRIIRHNGSDGSMARDRSGKLKMANKRAEVTWRFREMLEPGLGWPMAIPPDPDLIADLASYRWRMTQSGILIEEKAEIKKRIGRSPDKGDAVIIASAYGEVATNVQVRATLAREAAGRHGGPRVHLGHSASKDRRRR